MNEIKEGDGMRKRIILVLLYSALASFCITLLHEFAHALAASLVGVEVKGVELWWNGYVLAGQVWTGETQEAWRAIVIAAGPILFLYIPLGIALWLPRIGYWATASLCPAIIVGQGGIYTLWGMMYPSDSQYLIHAGIPIWVILVLGGFWLATTTISITKFIKGGSHGTEGKGIAAARHLRAS